MADEILYNAPADGTPSSIGPQFNDFYWKRKALIEAREEAYFGQLASVTNMPKHFGKKIKVYHYIPLLDDANINDQGIDAAGAILNQSVSIGVTMADDSVPNIPNHGRAANNVVYFVGEGVTAAAAGDAAILKVNEWMEDATLGGGLGLTLIGSDADEDFWDGINSADGLAYVIGFRFSGLETLANEAAALVAVDALAVPESGNLYGSTKDIGLIANKMPTLGESGGRVNRVGFTRITLEGTISKFGFFDEYSAESMNFDTDAQLQMHINREMITGANQITEDAIQIDLLNAAGVVRFGGSAVSNATVSGEDGEVSIINYEDLMKLSIDLDNNRTPKNTTRITGTKNTDTKTTMGARYLYCGSELKPMCRRMTDLFENQAFISVEKYAAGGAVARGEIGQIDEFKIIVVPKMLHWAGAGKAVTTNSGYRESGGNYDIYPMLIVGDQSFTTIGFQTNGKSFKFKIKHVKPESDAAYGKDDPFGELGFMSIKWYYGTMIMRPERIALIKCVAEW